MRAPCIGVLAAACLLAGCGRLDEVGRAPELGPLTAAPEYTAVFATPLPDRVESAPPSGGASLWNAGARSLLGDRRASRPGDILTVVIEIDDSAEIRNASGRNRSGSDTMGIVNLFGLPQTLDPRLPDGAGLATAVDAGGSSTFAGSGSVSRNERLTLRVAATVAETMPNGVLRIVGTQEVRVNHELRELTVTGYVRPSDVSRQNEVAYDRIAGARISYGGRGVVSDVQQPRYGQQLADILLPF